MSPSRVLLALVSRTAEDASTSSTLDISTGNSGVDEFLNLMSSPFKSEFESNSILAAFGTSVGAFVALVFGFSLLRPRHRVVYAPKLKLADEKHTPPPIGNRMFSWVRPLAKTKEEQLVEKIGLDATIFLRFTKMLRNMFIIISIIGCGVMIPVNVVDSNKSISTGAALAVMTPQFVFGSAYWAHVVCAWVFDIIIAYFLWHNYRRVRRLRRQYFASSEYQRSLHARTLMITDVPQKLRSDEGLMRITDEVNPTGVLPRATIGRNVKGLPKIIEEYEETVKELESVLAKYFKNPDKLPAKRPTMRAPKKFAGDGPSGKVDAIDYLTGRIKSLETEIKDTRDRIDKRDAMPFGFTSWEQIEHAHLVAYTARKKSPQGTEIVLAPRPHDLIWENLPVGKHARRTRRLMNNIWVSILTLIWMPINACIAVFLSNLSNLGLVWPAFQKQLEAHSTLWAIVQGIAAPALTSAVYMILPVIFRRLSIRAGDTTKTARERHVIHNLYAFFVFNNLIIFSLFSALWYYVAAIVAAKQKHESVWHAVTNGDIFIKIMLALCQVSPYWITWLLQRNLGAVIDLAQLLQLFWVWFAKTFMSPTPRQHIEWTAPPPFDYANYYNYFLFYATSALCFATLQPVVLPVTAAYFALDCWMKKYMFLYIYVTKNESGGQFWRVVYNRMVFAAILANVIIALVVKARGTWIMIAALAPAPFCLLGFKFYCMKTFDADMHFYVRTGSHDQEALAPGTGSKRTTQITSKYGHPAMYKSLITPMVNAKAKHVLSEVYHGRLDEDNGVGSYSDYALDNMAPSKVGSAKPPDAPFELVSEAQMDFANYKNRADFRDEFSGGIYGKPEDLISERSQTPKSFLGRTGTWSPNSSRASSSSPDPTRQPFDESIPVPDIRNHPAFRRPDSNTGDVGELDTRSGAYTNPYHDEAQTGLLYDTQGPPILGQPGGQQYGLDRWRTNESGDPGGYGQVRQDVDDEPVSYDYYRGRR